MNCVMVWFKMYIYINFEFIYGNYMVERKGFVFFDFIREKERRGFMFFDFIRIFDLEYYEYLCCICICIYWFLIFFLLLIKSKSNLFFVMIF